MTTRLITAAEAAGLDRAALLALIPTWHVVPGMDDAQLRTLACAVVYVQEGE